jgi:hypothetical protein
MPGVNTGVRCPRTIVGGARMQTGVGGPGATRGIHTSPGPGRRGDATGENEEREPEELDEVGIH